MKKPGRDVPAMGDLPVPLGSSFPARAMPGDPAQQLGVGQKVTEKARAALHTPSLPQPQNRAQAAG